MDEYLLKFEVLNMIWPDLQLLSDENYVLIFKILIYYCTFKTGCKTAKRFESCKYFFLVRRFKIGVCECDFLSRVGNY